MEKAYDLLVVGAGIAGCEAAWRATGLGAEVLLLTMSLDQVNLPGHLPALFLPSREGGFPEKRLKGTLFGEALARSVMGAYELPPEKEAVLVFDSREFSLASKELIEKRKGLDARQALVKTLHNKGLVTVESVFGEVFTGKCAIIAPGSYVKGRIRTGSLRLKSGRYGDLAADGLAESLRRAGVEMREWAGSIPVVVDMRRLNLEPWKKAEKAGGLSMPRGVKKATDPDKRPLLWMEKGDGSFLLVPLGIRSNEAFLARRTPGPDGLPPWAEGALVRMPVEQECLVVAGDKPEMVPGVVFAGSFNGARGYLDCAEDGAARAQGLLEKGS